MPQFQYTVRDAIGTTRNGTTEAENAETLKRRLQEQGFHVNDVKRAAQAGRYDRLKSVAALHYAIRQEDRLVFWLEFSLLLDSNTPLLRALEIAAEQTASRKMRETLHKVRAEIEAGSPLFEAMGRCPQAFDRAAVGMIRAGDVGGTLPEAVRRFYRYLEADTNRRAEARQRSIIAAVLLAAFCTSLCVLNGRDASGTRANGAER